MKFDSRVGLLFFCILVFPQKNSVNAQNDKPLFLTPLIEAGEIESAQNLSLVKDFYGTGILSHSGLITVNQEYNSNLFFWFFPASINSSEAPVLLWNEGGPAISGLYSLFNLNGPFLLENETLGLRKNSWQLTNNIIYLDSPVGVGFSFTENEAGNVNSGPGAAPDLYKFLLQFFKLFPNLQQNDFYSCGASYGATYAIAVGHLIHTKNQEVPEILINLKGLVLESPWIDPITQADYGTYLYTVGLIDEITKNEFDEQRNSIQNSINQQNYIEAFRIWSEQTIMNMSNVVGYSPLYNILKDQPISNFNITDIVTSESARSSLHVGNLTFFFLSTEVQSAMQTNFMASIKPSLEIILNAGYKTIIYAGNLDVITSHLGVQKMISSMKWDGGAEFANTTRSFWHVNENLAGYVKSAKNFIHIMMRNAGHGCNGDQPLWGLDLINRFTNNEIPF